MEAVVSLLGGIVVAFVSLAAEKNISPNVVRIIVIILCIVVGFVVYLFAYGAPTTNSLAAWATVTLGAFGVAAGFYSWVLKHTPAPTLEEEQERALTGELPPTEQARWI